MAYKNTSNEDNEFGEEKRQPKFVKYFIKFEGQTFQPSNIERIEQKEEANQDSFGGEDDCLLYKIIIHTRDYPYILSFPFFSEESRADALTQLHAEMADNRISISS